MSFSIKKSKTDQTKKGHFIYIFNLQSPTLLYQALLAFLQLRKSQSKSPSNPLFTDDSNRPVTRFWFQKHLKSVLFVYGIPANNFSSHSFRIGPATTAAQNVLSQQQFQTLSRWSSEAFKSNIRSDRSHIMEAHRNLISRPPSTPFHLLLTAACSCRSFSVCTFATAMTTPTEECICISLPPQQSPLSQKPYSISDVAAEHASAEATFSFRCRSRARVLRRTILFQMPQQSLLPQKPLSLSDAAAEHASSEAPFYFRCRRIARFRRTLSCISLLPQQ